MIAPELWDENAIAWEAWQWLCGTANPTVPISEIEGYCRLRGLQGAWDIAQKLFVVASVRSDVQSGKTRG